MCSSSSRFTALPTIQQAVSKHSGVIDGVYWIPQVIGGSGFIISSCVSFPFRLIWVYRLHSLFSLRIFIMIETQKICWKPRVLSLGWQIGCKSVPSFPFDKKSKIHPLSFDHIYVQSGTSSEPSASRFLVPWGSALIMGRSTNAHAQRSGAAGVS